MALKRTLKLASPSMRGADVKQLQKVLRGGNAFKKDFRPGKIDGVYGPYTAAAVYRAKHFLGYPGRRMNKHAGPAFFTMLDHGLSVVPSSYRRRHKRRLAQKARRQSLRAKALKSAMAKKGLDENPPGSNKNFLTRWWYGNETAAPWCAISVSHSYITAGSKAFSKGRDWAYVPFMEAAAAEGDRGLARIGKSGVKPGDIVTFNFDGGVADHVGIFVKWIDYSRGKFKAIEGNTNGAGSAEGGSQIVQERTTALVSQFIQVLK